MYFVLVQTDGTAIGRFNLVDTATDRLMAATGLRNGSPGERSRQLWFGRFAGMTSAEFGLQTLAARTTRDIVASRQVLTKAGFVPVGPAAHVTAVGALWLDGSFWFQTGSHTRKNRHVARDPRCSIAVSIRDADVVAEGEAALETDLAALTRLAKAWADQG